MYNPSPEQMAHKLFEVWMKDVESDSFDNFEPGETNHFWLRNTETGKEYKVVVTEG